MPFLPEAYLCCVKTVDGIVTGLWSTHWQGFHLPWCNFPFCILKRHVLQSWYTRKGRLTKWLQALVVLYKICQHNRVESSGHGSELLCFRLGYATTSFKILEKPYILILTYEINQVVRCSLRFLLGWLYHETVAQIHALLLHFSELNTLVINAYLFKYGLTVVSFFPSAQCIYGVGWGELELT